LAARDRALKKHGKHSLEKLVVYASDQTHSALQKACQIAGIFSENVRVVIADCNKNYAVAPEAVSEALSIDLSSGLIPFFICATVSNLPCFFSYANFLDLEMLRIYKLVWT
jgi:aromatic-L-amino-acid decarboxylase